MPVRRVTIVARERGRETGRVSLTRDEARRELERAGARVVVASTVVTPVQPAPAAGAKPVKPDILQDDVKAADFDAVIFTGGPGVRKYMANPAASRVGQRLIRSMLDAGKCVAAIDTGPQILAHFDVIRGRKVTGHEWIRGKLQNFGGLWSEESVVRDGQIVTARNPESAEAFVREVLRPVQAGKRP